ncbi:MAG: sugar transferase [Gammaproteobacteria bacterium]
MFKRLFDVILVLISAPAWISLLALTALILLIAEGRPLLFIQERAGRHGKPFRLLKFRTMSNAVDADDQLLGDAERITRVGRLLRSSSLDEIPQLINVLKGDMSLVGPRPLLMEYLPLYSEKHARRHEVRPGITGLAQISGRNLLSWDDRFDLDIAYVESRSMAVDLRILMGTVSSVLRKRGISGQDVATMHRYRGPGS